MNASTEIRETRGMAVLEPSLERLERLGAWFRAEYPAMLRFAYFVAGDPALAEDLVQDAFIRLYRAPGELADDGLRAYTRRTIVNLSKNVFRRRRTERAAAAKTGPTPHVEGPDLGARDEVWRAIQGLSPRQRAVVALRFYEDMSERDIADALGMSAGSVKKHTDRAMTTLRTVLGDRRTA